MNVKSKVFCIFFTACLGMSFEFFAYATDASPKTEIQYRRRFEPVKFHEIYNICTERMEVAVNLDGVEAALENHNILVTGGAGSIGGELVRKVCEYRPSQVIILDTNENAIHEAQLAIRSVLSSLPSFEGYPLPEVHFVLGSMSDRTLLESIFRKYKINLVFHAAAYKHIHILEKNYYQAIRNNVEGTFNLLKVALKFEVKKFINISTDKAVNPSGFLGASKRITELLVRQAGERAGKLANYASVRFGNVFGSSGSVGPTFEKQIRKGGPVTITDPRMKRYLMSIPEAAELVLAATTLQENPHSIYLLEMGEPVYILDIAKVMIRYMGFEASEIEIQTTGRRPAEKLEEELVTSTEAVEKTKKQKILRIVDPTTTTDIFEKVGSLLDPSTFLEEGMIKDAAFFVKELQSILPEFKPLLSDLR